LHLQRIWVGSLAAVVASAAILAYSFGMPEWKEGKLAWLSGRVTYQGQPVQDTMICLDANQIHCVSSALRPDGTFEITRIGHFPGVVPTHYRVHFVPTTNRSHLPDKYERARTSGLELDVVPGWNGFSFGLL
jgi:hypothetical protein